MANKVILRGNLARAAEVNDEATRAVLTIATDDFYNGEKHTEYHRVFFFKKLVKSCVGLKKGRNVYVEAKLQHRKEEGKSDQKPRYFTNIIGSVLEF